MRAGLFSCWNDRPVVAISSPKEEEESIVSYRIVSGGSKDGEEGRKEGKKEHLQEEEEEHEEKSRHSRTRGTDLDVTQTRREQGTVHRPVGKTARRLRARRAGMARPSIGGRGLGFCFSWNG